MLTSTSMAKGSFEYSQQQTFYVPESYVVGRVTARRPTIPAFHRYITTAELDALYPAFTYAERSSSVVAMNESESSTMTKEKNLKMLFAAHGDQTCIIRLEEFIHIVTHVRQLGCGHVKRTGKNNEAHYK